MKFRKLKLKQWAKLFPLAFLGYLIFSPVYATDFSTERLARATHLDSRVIEMALKAHRVALRHHEIPKDHLLTIIDYSRPSTERRLWVIDLKKMRVLFNTVVAHGRGTGSHIAQFFSDQSGSHQSSLGVFKTGVIYHGSHGQSLKLHGLEKGFNGNAYNRGIVIHGAHYVYPGMKGRLGLSHGCPALSEQEAPEIIQKIKNGSLIFAYYPDKRWLNHSRYLN